MRMMREVAALVWNTFLGWFDILFCWSVFRFVFCSGWRPPLLFFTGSHDKTVRIWDVSTQQQVAELRGHTREVTSVAFDGSGKYLASGEVAEGWSVLEHVFAPFLECCCDAVMFAKQNAVLDDEDDVTVMMIVLLMMKLRWWLWRVCFVTTFKCDVVFFLFVLLHGF